MKPLPAVQPPDPLTVLVVDDLAANRNLLRETLETEGYEVLLAQDGETALRVAVRSLPDLILLDINMPGLDGLDTCRRLKQDPATLRIPVVFITANDGTETILAAFRAGGIDYVVKPFRAEEVLLRVETHVQIHRLNRALDERNRELSDLNRALQAEIVRRQRAEQSLQLLGEEQTARFHAGGTLRHDAPSYVERQADRDLHHALLHGECCHVLTSRQMGKSSLMVRCAHRLRSRERRIVSLDLAAIGQNLTPEQWYDGLIARVGWQLEIEDQIAHFWSAHQRLGPLQRFLKGLRDIVLAPGMPPLVVFVDELDTVRSLPFPTDEFFAAIRESQNRRAEDPAFDRVTFCLLGVASPAELTGSAYATPFNIGRRIELNDFAWPEMLPLAAGLRTDPREAEDLLQRVFYWTHGHPYLTQKLCRSITLHPDIATPAQLDDLCHAELLHPSAREQDDNLLFVREQLLRAQLDRPGTLACYRSIRSGEPVEAEERNPEQTVLRLSGIARQEGGRWVVRNRIYERVFDLAWIDRACS